jgi:dihydroflavonol-4-reductase
MAGKICVTGATGYIARHIIHQALDAGYSVAGTARSAEKVHKLEKDIKHPKFRGHFAELTASWGWQAAMSDCKAVIHCASPFPLSEPKHPHDVIEPAIKGVEHALKAAHNSGVKRVIITSSCAAVGYGHIENNRYFTAGDWSDLSGSVGSYVRSKTMAEKQAWKLVKKYPEIELVTINPSLVLGPRLAKQSSASINLVQMVLAGKYPLVPKLSLSPVDVRDVAAAHIAALKGKRSVGKRFILAGDSVWMSDITGMLKAHSKKASSREMPNLMTRMVAAFDPNVKSVLSELGLMRYYDTQPSRKILKFSPRPLSVTLDDMVDSLQKL